MASRVLIVHGVPAIRTIVAQAIARDGCTPIGVDDWGAVSELPSCDAPDVIVTDERVIEADPRAFQLVRARFPEVIVVALTAPLRKGPHPIHDGVACTIEKPPEDEHIVRAVRWALEIAEAARPERRS